MKPPSQNDRILAVLQDGREHEMRDIHRIAGFCRLNSRISELRKRGYVITCRREGNSYFYRLVRPEPVYACVVDESAGLDVDFQVRARRLPQGAAGETPPGLVSQPEQLACESEGRRTLVKVASTPEGELKNEAPTRAYSAPDSSSGEQLALTDSVAAHIYRDLARTPF